MKDSFFKIFTYFNYSLTQQEVLDPIVSVQPRIKYKILNKSPDKLEDDAESSTTQSDKGIVAYLELKFAIDYRDYFEYNTHIQKTVSLKRYKRKQSPNEKYVEAQHQPEIIILPPAGRTLGGYTLDIFQTEGEDEKRNEMIILHTTKNVLSLNIDTPFANISEEFTEYMVGEWKQRNDFAFRFIVELTSYSDSALLTTIKKLIETNLFVLEIANKGDCIEILSANGVFFHLDPKPRVVKQTTLKKFMAPIRKFFRR